jgi:putative Mg2+ transporter-C (MgtC) family protein
MKLDLTEFGPIIWRLILALGLGTLIGLERRLRRHPAGIHTNALVALGSAAFVVAGILLPGDPDHSRIAAQVVTGIGFICAGVIFHHGATVLGLNTAATVWCSAAVGMLAGAGLTTLSVVVAVLVLATNIILHWIEHKALAAPNDPER